MDSPVEHEVREHVCPCSGGLGEIQASSSTRPPSALPRYATIPGKPDSDRPERQLEQVCLTDHPSFLGACQRNPCSKGVRRPRGFCTRLLFCLLLPLLHPKCLFPAVRSAFPPSWLTPRSFGWLSSGEGAC